MDEPPGFSWIENPRLAALARPESLAELSWLKEHGIDLLLSLTEEPPNRRDINEAGLMLVHVPIEDMAAPSREDFERSIATIEKALASGLGVAA